MKNLQYVLAQGGVSFDRVVKTTCFLSDINDFAAFNGVYAKYFTEQAAGSLLRTGCGSAARRQGRG